MLLTYLDHWLLFTILFGLLLIVTLIMIKQSRHFYTKDMVVRKFSIMELELPASPKELVNLISGLYLLPPAQSQQSVRTLKSRLRLDFLFMPLAYGSVFLLSWKVAHKMQYHTGHYIFLAFAFLQLVPWIFDLIGNIYLSGKIKPVPTMTGDKQHTNYLRMEAARLGITLTAAVCSASAVFYFWLTGNYNSTSFYYLLIVVGEIIIFLLAANAISKTKEIQSI